MLTAIMKIKLNIKNLDELREDMFRESKNHSKADAEKFMIKFHKACIHILLQAHFSKNERKILEKIHGGNQGILRAIELVGEINPHTKSLAGMERMIIMFYQMIDDYQSNGPFRVEFPN